MEGLEADDVGTGLRDAAVSLYASDVEALVAVDESRLDARDDGG